MRKLFAAKGASMEGAIHRIGEGKKDRAGRCRKVGQTGG
jgi:hypothetical protein